MLSERLAGLAGDRIMGLDVHDVRLEREVGQLSCEDYMEGTFRPTYRIGGGSITRVTLASGVVGIGPGVDGDLLPSMRDAVVGRDPSEVLELAPRLRHPPRRVGGAEIAIWDALGKLAGVPLYQLWGGEGPVLTPYASMMTRGTPVERAALAVALQREGWRAMKLRTSFPTLEEDVAVVRAVREAVGPDFVLLADGNKAGPYGPAQPRYLWDLARAEATASAFAGLGVSWLEEPLGRYDHAGMAALRSLHALPIAGGENLTSLPEYQALIDGSCVDVVNPEVMLLGPSLALEVESLARSRGLRCVAHMGHGGLGTLCALHLNAAWPQGGWAELIHEPPIADFRHGLKFLGDPIGWDGSGTVRLPDKPGLGVEIGDEWIAL